jgi:plastocyanin
MTKSIWLALSGSALLYLGAACANGTDPSHLCDDSGAAAVVTGTGSQTFAPPTVTITAGQSVCWHNDGRLAHTVSSDDQPASFASPLGTRTSYTHTFPAAGTFPYHCTVHQGMTGTVIVQ